ncbi:MAG: L-threonylcarbamoyladenylate synthase [Rubrobacteraceae bacterium]
MKTVSIVEATNVLRSGGVVLAPTETVVGLVAAEPGRRRLSEIKNRDPEKPVALLCASEKEALEMVSVVPDIARKLAELYWPGPLTLVLGSDGGGTVGVRVPDHEVIVELLTAYGEPLYATSANLAGKLPPASLEAMDSRVVASVDAVVEGYTGAGEASAVVDLSEGEPRLLRANSEITEDELSRLAEELGREKRENV